MNQFFKYLAPRHQRTRLCVVFERRATSVNQTLLPFGDEFAAWPQRSQAICFGGECQRAVWLEIDGGNSHVDKQLGQTWVTASVFNSVRLKLGCRRQHPCSVSVEVQTSSSDDRGRKFSHEEKQRMNKTKVKKRKLPAQYAHLWSASVSQAS